MTDGDMLRKLLGMHLDHKLDRVLDSLHSAKAQHIGFALTPNSQPLMGTTAVPGIAGAPNTSLGSWPSRPADATSALPSRLVGAVSRFAVNSRADSTHGASSLPLHGASTPQQHQASELL